MKKFYSLLTFMLVFSISYAQIPSGYYDAANGLTGDQLKAALHNIIDGHITYPYSSSGTDTWDILKEADRDPNNPNNVIGIYSGFSMNGPNEYDNGNGWSREHVWAKSRGDFGTTQGAGTDLHHLRAEDVSTNSARSNRNFDNADYFYVDGSGQYSGATLSKTSDADYIWEPRDAVKGDVARMIFYMVVRYEGTNGDPDLELTENYLDNTSKEPLHSKLSTLIQWHLNDPVDDFERQRNNVIYSYQNNRNPFIDHPEYVCQIYPTECGGSTPTNNAPQITSTPVTLVVAGSNYSYNIVATDADGDAISISSTNLPSWLGLIDNGDGTATLAGPASANEVGDYNVTINANDGTVNTSQTFTLTVEAQNGGGGDATELFISEYIEGSSFNKGLEVANYTGAVVDLSQYSLQKATNGGGIWASEYQLSGTLANGEVFVIVHSSADAAMQSAANVSTGSAIMTFNGNDAVALFKNGSLIDAVGSPSDGNNFAQDVTLVRKSSVSSPSATYDSQEWDQYTTDDFTHLGNHTFDGNSNPQPETCNVPANLAANTITTASADISWSGSAVSFTLQYRIQGVSTWTEVSTTNLNYSLSSLQAATTYEYKVAANCETTSSAFSTVSTFQTLAEPTCETPTNLAVSNVGTSSVDLTWTGNASAAGYGLRYRVVGTSSWSSVNVSTNTYSLTSLVASTTYEYEVRAECGGLNSTYSTAVSFTTTSDVVSYCSAGGEFANEEWIQRFVFNTIDNVSGSNGGYADFTDISTAVQVGQTYTFTVYPEWSGRAFSEAYDIWIDYNHDGDFSDAGEYVATIGKTRDSFVSGSFTIPNSAANGGTRMRVSMKYNRNSTPCETFTYGEVEDYTLNISGGSSARTTETVENVVPRNQNALTLYPNPTSKRVNIDFEVRTKASLEVVSLSGVSVKSLEYTKGEQIAVNISDLDAGIYLIVVKEANYRYVGKLIID